MSATTAASGAGDADPSTGRAWRTALIATVAVGSGMSVASVFASGIAWSSALVVVGVLAVYAVGMFVALPRLLSRPADRFGALEIAIMTVTIAVVAGLTVLVPWLAMLQFWIYPLLWTAAGTTRIAVGASLASALALLAALVPWTDGGSWAVLAVVQAASFASSVVLGLWITAISRYGAERDRLVMTLTDAQAQLASLHHDAGVIAERERLAAEMHDTIAQTLAGTVMLAQRARRELSTGALDDETLALVEDAARVALAESRTLVAAGAPVSTGTGLADALEILAARTARETGLDIVVRAEAVGGLERESEVALLRCAQEGLSNARRHSAARRIEVTLVEVDGAVELRVRDDGVGFDPGAPAAGFGLPGLRARLAACGGELHVDGAPGAVVLTARVTRGAVVA